jgi:hypothetical protein
MLRISGMSVVAGCLSLYFDLQSRSHDYLSYHRGGNLPAVFVLIAIELGSRLLCLCVYLWLRGFYNACFLCPADGGPNPKHPVSD